MRRSGEEITPGFELPAALLTQAAASAKCRISMLHRDSEPAASFWAGIPGDRLRGILFGRTSSALRRRPCAPELRRPTLHRLLPSQPPGTLACQARRTLALFETLQRVPRNQNLSWLAPKKRPKPQRDGSAEVAESLLAGSRPS